MRTIYYNGKVYTGEMPLVSAFIVEDGKFVFAGSDLEAAELHSCDDKVVDLEGRFVCAGFNDSHMHVLNYGIALNTAKLNEHTQSLEDMLKCLKDFLDSHDFPEGKWLRGRGWNQDYFTDVHRMPTRFDLDKVSTEVPIYITRACGHAAVMNTRLMNIIGLTKDTVCPEGGEIGMTDGEPDGRLFDGAMSLMQPFVPKPSKQEIKDNIEAACKALNSYGVTSAQTDDLCSYPNVSWQTVYEAFEELEKEGKLTVRIYEQANFSDPEEYEGFLAAGNITGKGTPKFKTGPLKLLADGALGARTALLSIPYADDPSTKGLAVMSAETLEKMADIAVRNGMQIATHAIGDACLDNVLNAYEKAFAKYPHEDHRCGIVHCQISRPDQLRKIADMKLHVYAQSIFLDYDIKIVEARVGKELASSSYSWKTLKELGATVSNGTDCPVELPFAMGGIQCMVTRKTLRGGEAYLPDEAFTVREAIDSYTKAGAYSSFEENFKGQIKPGMAADFVVLAGNPLEEDPAMLMRMPVMYTYMDGMMMWQNPEVE